MWDAQCQVTQASVLNKGQYVCVSVIVFSKKSKPLDGLQ